MMTIQGMKYKSDFEAKKAILDIGRRMYAKGFVASNDGNISCRVGPNTIWTTPTGVSKGFMTQDMLVKMDLDGKVLMGRLKPSSEIKMHLRVYQENPRLQAVTHAHPPMATCFAIAGQPLDAAILTEAILSLGTIPVARYATPGTQEVPDSIAPFVNHYNGVLLANHGALTWGDDIYQAFYRLESVEYYATILMYTGNIIGQQNHLSCEQVDRLLEIRKNHAYGEQNYYFDHPNTIGFTRVGDEQHPKSGVAVLISNGENGDKVMNVGKQHAGETWKEATGNVEETVTIDDEGNGQFIVHGGNVAVWIPENAPQDPKQDARKDDAEEES